MRHEAHFDVFESGFCRFLGLGFGDGEVRREGKGGLFRVRDQPQRWVGPVVAFALLCFAD